MGTFFYVIAAAGGACIIAVLIAMTIDFGEPPWRIFGKSGNK